MRKIIDALNKANKMLCGYDCNNTVFLVEAEKEALAIQGREKMLAKALRGLSNMYTHAWDSVDGCLIMLPQWVEMFEERHKAAQDVLAKLEKE